MNIQFLKDHIICALGQQAIEGDYLVFNDDSNLDFKVLPNFTLLELLTKNKKDSYTRINLNILLELQDIRDDWDSGIGVNSSYRSPAYNKSAGGAKVSLHLKSDALDTYPVNGKIKEYHAFIKKKKKTGGIGLYKTFVHIDVGPTRTWNG